MMPWAAALRGDGHRAGFHGAERAGELARGRDVDARHLDDRALHLHARAGKLRHEVAEAAEVALGLRMDLGEAHRVGAGQEHGGAHDPGLDELGDGRGVVAARHEPVRLEAEWDAVAALADERGALDDGVQAQQRLAVAGEGDTGVVLAHADDPLAAVALVALSTTSKISWGVGSSAGSSDSSLANPESAGSAKEGPRATMSGVALHRFVTATYSRVPSQYASPGRGAIAAVVPSLHLVTTRHDSTPAGAAAVGCLQARNWVAKDDQAAAARGRSCTSTSSSNNGRNGRSASA
eukprot:CAMPEP_0202062828 /NCGR_PEP_ID=MMETSP0963-20130614/44896_1 /ASSEMBLY_ACC=CAM_ASM_000494 /TAXON_ID=4773 /ORGANISM="Schizochytrium aggregatum, Strain ATCC28209" /LENGTH=292 /DNA_ID=CAMNT_0048629173 /DNA_START=20 /DNA_END=901 /DNA_ORIENTATION=+